MKLAVIIVTYNSRQVIVKCLDSIFASKIPLEVFIVDNNSRDETISVVKKNYSESIVILNQDNFGYAGGNNIGIETALEKSFDYFLILNPDTIILPGALEKLVLAAQKEPALYGPQIFFNDVKKSVWSIGGELDQNRYTAKLLKYPRMRKDDKSASNFATEFISGTCLLIPQRILRDGLRFYEPYFMYYEDVEFCLRAKLKGYPSVIIPQAQIVHVETSKKTESVKKYYLARNHLLFVERNAPFKVQLHELLRFPKTVWEHLSQNSTALVGIHDYLFRKFGLYDIKKESWQKTKISSHNRD